MISTRDFNMGVNDNMWPVHNFDRTWRSVPNFDAFPSLPCSVKQNLGYEKEVLKQIMLKQEAIFVDQVSELHRLYRRQKELMNDIERRQLLHSQMQPQHCSSQLEPKLVEKTLLSTTTLQPPSNLKWSNQLLTERKKPAKRMWDLELPADAYLDSEEGEQFEDKKVSEVRDVAREDYGLIDLNGPVQVEEEEKFLDDLGLVSNIDLRVQCPIFSLPLAKNQEPSECTNFALESSQRSFNLHLQNYPRSMASCIRTSQKLIPPSYVTKSDPSSVVSLRKPCGNLSHIPMAVQALPCFKSPPSLHRSSKLSVVHQGMIPDKDDLNRDVAANPYVEEISSLQKNLFSESHIESMKFKAASTKAIKATDTLTPMESGISQALTHSSYIDLEKLEYSASENYDTILGDISCMPSYQISTAASNSHQNRFEEINNSEKVRDLGYGSNWLVTRNEADIKPSDSGTLIDLNSCISENEMTLEFSVLSAVTKTGIERDLEAPVSPENKEGSPPRGESEGHPLEPAVQVLKQEGKDRDEELVRVAAETIVSFSLSEQLQADNDCLIWFAGIISSVTSNLENNVELSPQGRYGFELEPYLCKDNGLKVNRENGTSLPSQQKKERTRRVRKQKDFMGFLPYLAEPAEIVVKRSTGKNHCSKRRRRAVFNCPDPCLMEVCVGWGKANRRKRGRRAAAGNPYRFCQMGRV